MRPVLGLPVLPSSLVHRRKLPLSLLVLLVPCPLVHLVRLSYMAYSPDHLWDMTIWWLSSLTCYIYSSLLTSQILLVSSDWYQGNYCISIQHGPPLFYISRRHPRSKFVSSPGVLASSISYVKGKCSWKFSLFYFISEFFPWSFDLEKPIPCLPSLLLRISLASSLNSFKI